MDPSLWLNLEGLWLEVPEGHDHDINLKGLRLEVPEGRPQRVKGL